MRANFLQHSELKIRIEQQPRLSSVTMYYSLGGFSTLKSKCREGSHHIILYSSFVVEGILEYLSDDDDDVAPLVL